MKALLAGLGVIAGLVLILVLVGIGALVGGLVIWLLWNEVIAPIVNDNGGNLNDISYWLAVGVSLVLSVVSGVLKGGS